MRHKRDEDHRYEQEEDHSGLGEGSLHTYRSMSGAFGHERFDRRDEELEHLRRLVRDLELEVRGRRWRRDLEKHVEGSTSVGVAMESHPINPVPFDTEIGFGSIQTETQFSQRGDNPKVLPWVL